MFLLPQIGFIVPPQGFRIVGSCLSLRSGLSHFALLVLRDQDERFAPGIRQSLNLAPLPLGESHLDLTL